MILRDGILCSALFEDFPVIHGFTTRALGNLGFGKNPDDPEVTANRKQLFETLHLDQRVHIQPKQVHSDRCVEASEFQPGVEADASVSRSAGDLLSVLTADCIPILLYHKDGAVAAVHAGWRGLFEEIIPKSLKKLPPYPAAVIGPAIGACCYEVGEDLAEKFEKKFGQEVVVPGKKPHLDLVRIAVFQLQEAGVDELDVAHLCTFCHADLFFSFRREGSAGRLMSFIGLQ